MLAALVAAAGCLSASETDADPASPNGGVHEVPMLAVEWKGGTNVESEPFPGTAGFPPGVGYGIKAPDETGRWEVNAYRWDPGTVVVRSGEAVTLSVFGVNGAHHESEIEGHDVHFNVTRGTFTEVSFTAGPPGLYRIVCHTHEPSMEATLVVLPAGDP